MTAEACRVLNTAKLNIKNCRDDLKPLAINTAYMYALAWEKVELTDAEGREVLQELYRLCP